VLTGGTDKYQRWTVGTQYGYRAVLTNPPVGGLATVYVEVTFHGAVGHQR
jgi:hypothetical protein